MMMMIRPIIAAALLVVSMPSLTSCTSPDDVAARNAAEAATLFNAGALPAAKSRIRNAIAARDDVSDYWLLLAHIDTALGDGAATYSDYRSLIALDRANVEALRALCQLGGQFGDPDELEKFADQLALIQPNDPLPQTARGNAALARGNLKAATKYADAVLATTPLNVEGLALKSTILRAQGKYSEAAQLLENAAQSLGNTPALLVAMNAAYQAARDRTGYQKTLVRLNAADPDNVDTLLRLTDLRYQDGARDEARALARQIAKLRPGDVATANALLTIWLDEGATALTPDEIMADSADASVEMKAAYAQYANETGHPDLALKIIDFINGTGFSPDKLDAQASYADALRLTGNIGGATKVVDRILDADPQQPRALLLRSRLLFARGDIAGAIADARQVATDDRGNPPARMLLAGYLAARGDELLSLSALREGVAADPGSVRLVTALVKQLLASGRKDEASDVLIAMARAAPLDLRAQGLRTRLCPLTGVARCLAGADPDDG